MQGASLLVKGLDAPRAERIAWCCLQVATLAVKQSEALIDNHVLMQGCDQKLDQLEREKASVDVSHELLEDRKAERAAKKADYEGQMLRLQGEIDKMREEMHEYERDTMRREEAIEALRTDMEGMRERIRLLEARVSEAEARASEAIDATRLTTLRLDRIEYPILVRAAKDSFEMYFLAQYFGVTTAQLSAWAWYKVDRVTSTKPDGMDGAVWDEIKARVATVKVAWDSHLLDKGWTAVFTDIMARGDAVAHPRYIDKSDLAFAVRFMFGDKPFADRFVEAFEASQSAYGPPAPDRSAATAGAGKA